MANSLTHQNSSIPTEQSSSYIDLSKTVEISGLDITNAITSSSLDLNTALSSTSSDISASIIELESSINKSINLLSTDLVRTIIQTNDGATLSTFIFASFIALIGPFSAYLFTFFHWRKLEKRRNSSNLGKGLIDLIKELEIISLKYWISELYKKKKETIQISEIKIKSIIRQINKQTILFSDTLSDKNTENRIDKLNSFKSEIFDLVTGDDFESKIRKPSRYKATKIATQCTDARVAITSIISRV